MALKSRFISVNPAFTPMAARILAALCALFAIGLEGMYAAPAPTEYEVKAAFLLNFTKFAEWPPASFPAADSPLAICVIGKDPFGNFLDGIVQGETIDGRKVVVRRFDEAPAAGLCQLAYVGVAEAGQPQTVAALKPGVLTVGEGDRFLRDGGIIAFVLDRNHVRFLINPSAAVSAGLKLSSRLLSVAKAPEK